MLEQYITIAMLVSVAWPQLVMQEGPIQLLLQSFDVNPETTSTAQKTQAQTQAYAHMPWPAHRPGP